MLLGHPFEFWAFWGSMGVSVLHKLNDIARTISAATASTKDDEVVSAVDKVLNGLDAVLSKLPGFRMGAPK